MLGLECKQDCFVHVLIAGNYDLLCKHIEHFKTLGSKFVNWGCFNLLMLLTIPTFKAGKHGDLHLQLVTRRLRFAVFGFLTAFFSDVCEQLWATAT